MESIFVYFNLMLLFLHFNGHFPGGTGLHNKKNYLHLDATSLLCKH